MHLERIGARTIICAAVLVIAALVLAAIGTYPFLFLDTYRAVGGYLSPNSKIWNNKTR